MTEYAADTDGAVVCVDCLHGACVSSLPCEEEACECECNRARELDDRPADKLRVVAAELAAENRPALRDLLAERFR